MYKDITICHNVQLMLPFTTMFRDITTMFTDIV